MSRYIDADELHFTCYYQGDCYAEHPCDKCADYACTKEDVDNTPTANVKPVVHGKWIYTPHKRLIDETDEGPIYEKQEKCSCSVCGADFGFRKVEDNYCKYCGADMRGREDGSN